MDIDALLHFLILCYAFIVLLMVIEVIAWLRVKTVRIADMILLCVTTQMFAILVILCWR